MKKEKLGTVSRHCVMKQLPVFFADSQQRVWSGRHKWAECAREPGAYDPDACFSSCLAFSLYMKINVKT